MLDHSKTKIATAANELTSLAAVLLLPVHPRNWRLFGIALAMSPGWMPSMMLIALFGMGLFLQGLFNWLLGPQLVVIFSTMTWLSWLAICSVAMFCCIRHSIAQLQRMGLVAASRARWWFEVAFLIWNTFFLWIGTLVAASYMLDLAGNQVVGQFVWSAITASVAPGFTVMGIAFFCSIAVSVAQRRILYTRASLCVYYYGGLFTSLPLMGIGLDAWAIPTPPMQKLIATVVGILGLGILLAFGTLGVLGWQRFDTRIESNHQLRREAARENIRRLFVSG